MGRHERKQLVPNVVQVRMFTVLIGLGAVALFVIGVRQWGDREAVLAALGGATFVASFAVLLGGTTFRSRPFKSFGTGVCVLVMGLGAFAVLLGHEAVAVALAAPVLSSRRSGEGWVQALSVVFTVVLPLVGIGLMLDRPKLHWQREEERLRAETEGSRDGHSGADSEG